jgi:tetratricopeptide (TPR) repeat protein
LQDRDKCKISCLLPAPVNNGFLRPRLHISGFRGSRRLIPYHSILIHKFLIFGKKSQMIRSFFSAFLLLLPAATSLAQTDSLIFFRDLRFDTESEKEAFLGIEKNTTGSYLELFLGLDTSLSATERNVFHEEFFRQISRWKNAGINSPNFGRYGKNIFRDIHTRVFKKYELETQFSDIFRNGVYNCVTASAYYALLLKEIDIPYKIRETPQHIYLVANPGSSEILFESTNPQNGYTSFDLRFKESYVNSLHDSKLISDEEIRAFGVEKLFLKYYFQDSVISLRQLGGIHYYNDGIYLMNKKRYRQAVKSFEKSYFLYPGKRTEFALFNAYASVLNATDYSDFGDLDYFSRISRYSSMGVTRDHISSEFGKINTRFLLNSSNHEYYERCYRYLTENIRDTDFLNQVVFFYNYERGRIYAFQGSNTRALAHLKDALKVMPENIEAQNLFMNCFIASLKNSSDIRHIQKQIDEYSSVLPGLKENMILIRLQCGIYLEQFKLAYFLKNTKDGERYRALFEGLKSAHAEVDLEGLPVADAYSQAAVYFFGLGNYSKAKSMLKKGLEYSPNNTILLTRLKSIP